MRTCVVWLLVHLLLAAGSAMAEPAAKPGTVRLRISLTDGSCVIGESALQELPLQAGELGLVKLPVARIRSIQCSSSATGSVVGLVNGDKLQGTVGVSALDVVTIIGRVSIPFRHVTEIRVSAAGEGDLDTGLVLHFDFDHLEGGHLPDLSPSQATGLIHLEAPPAGAKLGGTLDLNGRGDYVEVPFSDALNLAPDSEFTLSVWVRPQPLGRCQALLVKGASEYWDWGIFVSAEHNFFSGTPGQNGFALVSRTAVQADHWYQVVVTYRDGAWVLYVDGQVETEGKGHTVGQSRGGVAVGRKGQTDGYPDFCQATFGDVRVYRRALSGEEVATLYETLKGRKR